MSAGKLIISIHMRIEWSRKALVGKRVVRLEAESRTSKEEVLHSSCEGCRV